MRTQLIAALYLLSNVCAELVTVPDLGLKIEKGFSVSLYADSVLAPDVYSMTLDPEGFVVISSRGYIKRLIDEDGDGVAEKGKVIRKSKRNDIAVITTNKPNATTCIIADTSPEILGDVITVGHPLELFYTVSKGSINAYRDRKQDFMANKDSMRVYSIHMDAPIYRGNSGGPLFYKGKVIGVNTFKYEDTTLNFSIHHNIFTRYLN